mgnify:CR=1 FL=1
MKKSLARITGWSRGQDFRSPSIWGRAVEENEPALRRTVETMSCSLTERRVYVSSFRSKNATDETVRKNNGALNFFLVNSEKS